MTPQDEFSSFGTSEEQPQPQGQASQPEGQADEFADFSAGAPQEAATWGTSGDTFTATATVTAEGDPSKDNWAIAATVVGVLSLCLAIIPLCGFPTSLAAIGLGAFSLKAPNRRTLAIVGIVLGGIAILLSICSAGFGLLSVLGQQGGGY